MSNVTLMPDSDHDVRDVADALAPYTKQHPSAEITIRRSSRASIHVRVIDPDFEIHSRVAREESVWPLLESLPDDTFTQITVLLLLSPRECHNSSANVVYFGPPDPAPASI